MRLSTVMAFVGSTVGGYAGWAAGGVVGRFTAFVVSVVGSGVRAQTGPDGRYTLAGLSAGTARVRVQMIGYTPAEREATLADSGTTT